MVALRQREGMTSVWPLKAGNGLILVGGLLGVGLILYGIWRYNVGSGAPAVIVAAPSQQVSRVVTAARPLARGQLIAAADLTSTPVLGAPPPGAVVTPAQAVGRIAIVDIQPQQLVLGSLISAEAGAAGLAMLVPAGSRAVSIDTTDDIAVGGFIRPGDTVDIAIVLPEDVVAGQQTSGPDRGESRTLLQGIRVLTVGPTLGHPAEKDAEGKALPPARTLTLVLTPSQVSRFMLARKLGQFYLLLRNPRDEAVVPEARAVLASLRGGAPGPAAPRATTPAPRTVSSAPRAIELIVGGQRQIVYPSAGVQ